MKHKIFVGGPLLTNTVLLYDAGEGILIDPADQDVVEEVKLFCEENEISVKFIVNTHEHPDHTSGNAWAKVSFPSAKLGMHPLSFKHLKFWTEGEIGKMIQAEPSPEPDILLNSGDSIEVGKSRVEVLHLPGHSPGSICLISRKDKLAVVGDLIFKGSIGRYDLPMSDFLTLKSSILKLLATLDEDYLIIPGHGETTMVRDELRFNPFVEEFLK
jgi:glyoxylase-like metal-dependent hydrolase (beta-lactamase superfamily II)